MRELQNILSSGEITNIYLTGITDGNQVLRKEEIQLLLDQLNQNIQNNAQDITNINQEMDLLKGSLDITTTAEDIDNIITPGKYYVSTNTPDQTSGLLEVYTNGSRVLQYFTSDTIPETQIREQTSGNWSQWIMDAQSAYNHVTHNQMLERPTFEHLNKAVVNYFSGTTDPDPTLGKTGDRYHKFLSTQSETIRQGVIQEDFNDKFDWFDIYYDQTAVGLITLSVNVKDKKIYTDYNTETSNKDDYSLVINGTTIPLNLTFSGAYGDDFTFDSSYVSIFEGIKTGDTFQFNAQSLSGKELDYLKYNNEWVQDPVYDKTYDYVTVGINDTGNPIVIQNDSFQKVAELTVQDRKQGLYEINFTITWKLNSTASSAIFRWTIDGGSNWKTIQHESKDTTNDNIISYKFPKVTQGPFDFRLEARCEDNTKILTIPFAHITVERKG